MNSTFANVSEHSSHIYIADYTETTQSKRGVEIRDREFRDIEFCRLHNPKGIPCWGVNFERNQGFLKGINQCECMIASKHAEKKSWVCLMELKYCMDKNVATNAISAYTQLKSTYDHLRKQGILDPVRHRIYLNVSIPDHSHMEPFSNFVFTQNEIFGLLKTERIHLLRYNSITIKDESMLKPT